MKEPLAVQPEEERVLDLYEKRLSDVPEDEASFAQHMAGKCLDHRESWQMWIDWSETELFSWMVCQELSFRFYKSDGIVPPPLLDWVCEVAVGLRRKPKRQGRPPDNWARDITIAQLVSVIVSFGYRRATSSNEGGSACHLVADRLGLEYVSIRKIWKRERNI